MRAKYIMSLALAIILVAGTKWSQAQTAPVNITTTAVPFLRISPDARAGGMGDLSLATSADANSIFNNLAKTPFAAKPTSLGVTYTPWMHDIADGVYLLTAGGYHQLDEHQSVGASIRYFNLGDLPVSDYSGQKLMTSQPHEWAVDLGYARKLSGKLGLAIALRYINSKLATGYINGSNYKAASTVAGDLSLYYNGVDSVKGGWSAGLALSNLGGKIGYTDNADTKDFLPANLGLGVAYTSVFNEDNSILIGVDYNKLLAPKAPVDAAGMNDYYSKGVMEGWSGAFNNNAYSFSLGAEYNYRNQLYVRAGYLVVPGSAGDNGGFTAGIGLGLNIFKINLSYLAASGHGATKNPLSNTLRVGLLFDLK